MASGTIKAVVGRSDIVNNLTTNDSTKVLSAAQGYALNNKLITISSGSLHDIKSSGAYYLTNAVTDKPTSTGGSYVVGSNGSVVSGIFTQNTTGNTYAVRYDGSTWSYEQLALNSRLNNVAIVTTLGNFSSKETLDGYLDTLLSGMESDGVKQFRVVCNSAFDIFATSHTYMGMLYKTGINTTYSHAHICAMGTDTEISAYRGTGGWTYDRISLNSQYPKDMGQVRSGESNNAIIDFTNYQDGMYMLVTRRHVYYLSKDSSGIYKIGVVEPSDLVGTFSISGMTVTISVNQWYAPVRIICIGKYTY